jgi:hypothetical protein
MTAELETTRVMAYVVSIDIKDGVYDVIHAFGSRAVAQQYVDWQQQHSGDHCYISELPILLEWQPPNTEGF